MPLYQSDTTLFLQKITRDNASIKEMQRKNFNTWWNQPQDFEINEKDRLSEESYQPYE